MNNVIRASERAEELFNFPELCLQNPAVKEILRNMEQLYRNDAFGFEDFMYVCAEVLNRWEGDSTDDSYSSSTNLSGDEEKDYDMWSEKASEFGAASHRNSPRDS